MDWLKKIKNAAGQARKVGLDVIADDYEVIVTDCWMNGKGQDLSVYPDLFSDASDLDGLEILYKHISKVYSERIEAVKQKRSVALKAYMKSESELIDSIQQKEQENGE